ncbi:MAG: fibronectin type III domain-containing protein [Methylococcaceae bacterium]|nr:fibronectin type III domain-containing protein [Methylococcaceae bacterium]
MIKKILFTCVSFATSGAVFAQAATLNADFQLKVPVIHFQSGEQSQYYSADLEYLPNAAVPLTFVVSDYAVLKPETLPPQLLDLAQVTENNPPEIVDIGTTTARLTFVSSIPLACSVVYGKTLEFGAVATDSNMNGGAIIDHNPILTNLEPDSQYYYRVQGSDAQGQLYWSPLSSFTTVSATGQQTNFLALSNGATIAEVSSNFGGVNNNQTWGANSAIDGSAGTAWSSSGDGDNAFITIALAQTQAINTLSVWSRSMSNGSAKVVSFKVTIDTGEVLGPFQLPDTQKAYDFAINRTTSSIRLDVDESTGGNTGFVEIAAF